MFSAPRLPSALAATAPIGLIFLLAFTLPGSPGDRLESLALRYWPTPRHAPTDPTVLWVPAGDAGDASASLRHQLAQAIDALHKDGARAVLLTVPLLAPSDSSDLSRVRTFLDQPTDATMRERLATWERELDHDRELESAIQRAGNVVLWEDPSHPPLERFAAAAWLVAKDSAVDPEHPALEDTLYTTLADGSLKPSLPLAAWLSAHSPSADHRTPSASVVRDAATTLGLGSSALWIPRLVAGGAEGKPVMTPINLTALASAPRGTFKDRVVVLGSGPERALALGGHLSLGEATTQRVLSLEARDFYTRPPGIVIWRLALLVLLISWSVRVLPGRTRRRQWHATALMVGGLLLLEVAVLATTHLWLPLLISLIALPAATATVQWRSSAKTVAAERYEPFEPLPLTATAAAPSKASRGPESTQPLPGDSSRAARGPSLSEISRALNARLQEPTKEEVTEILLGKRQRPARPKLGRYELDREIGRGAMGTVYLGRDPRINRIVAIKAIPLAEEFNERDLAEARARFFREAEMAGQLRHPGIVTVYDAGEDDGIAWIAMEHLQGQILNQHALPDTLLPTATTLEIVARVADALDYAHEHHVIHRDVKPANIMIDNEARSVKLMDFGVARNTNTSSTRSGIVLGTPSFMSPEQLDGATITGRSDIFALGITLFQLLTGQLPFRADSMTGLMNSIVNAPHPPLHTIRPDLPPTIGSIIDTALAKSPQARYSRASLMAEALRAAARDIRP